MLQDVIQKFKEEKAMFSKYECPYCTQVVNLQFSMITHKRSGILNMREALCPDCKGQIVEVATVSRDLQNVFGGHGMRIIATPIIDKYKIIYPLVRNICIDELVPVEIKKSLNEAYSVLEQSLPAAAALARKALEDFLVTYLNAKGNNLNEKILSIPSTAFINPKILNSIRQCGNYALHPAMKAGVAREEAIFTIKSTKDLCEWFFNTLPQDNKIIDQISSKASKKHE